jgi:hypothetical protein
MANWKDLLIQYIFPLLSSGLIISALTSFYNDIYNKPNIQIKIMPNDIDHHISTIKVTNNGNMPARNTILTIEMSDRISAYDVFNSENMTINYVKKNPTNLAIYIPRLSVGNGAIIKIVIVSESKNIDYNHYNVYVTYDGGSIKVAGLEKALSFADQIIEFFSVWALIIGLLLGSISFLAPLIYRRILKRFKKLTETSLIYYMTSIDHTYNKYNNNKEQCIIHLAEIEHMIINSFKIGTINKEHYDLLKKNFCLYFIS